MIFDFVAKYGVSVDPESFEYFCEFCGDALKPPAYLCACMTAAIINGDCACVGIKEYDSTGRLLKCETCGKVGGP